MGRLRAEVHDVQNTVPDDLTVPMPAPLGPAEAPEGDWNYGGVVAQRPEPRAPIPGAGEPRDDARK
ncbi:MAG: hypothetical protein HY616_04030 [Candidatus Rokubacteria bacterium]|nr:hypothetical protein [Candidatus Rokubacteria bacterium]